MKLIINAVAILCFLNFGFRGEMDLTGSWLVFLFVFLLIQGMFDFMNTLFKLSMLIIDRLKKKLEPEQEPESLKKGDRIRMVKTDEGDHDLTLDKIYTLNKDQEDDYYITVEDDLFKNGILLFGQWEKV